MQLAENLRQMLALLEGERQALTGLDLERILVCADGKEAICGKIAAAEAHHLNEARHLDEECMGLLDAVSRQNSLNRRLRNMIADNVQTRLSALTGSPHTYSGRDAPQEASFV